MFKNFLKVIGRMLWFGMYTSVIIINAPTLLLVGSVRAKDFTWFNALDYLFAVSVIGMSVYMIVMVVVKMVKENDK
jgi:hypothetical protein